MFHNQNVLCLDQLSSYGRQLRAMEIVCAALGSSEKVIGRYPVLGTQIFIQLPRPLKKSPPSV